MPFSRSLSISMWGWLGPALADGTSYISGVNLVGWRVGKKNLTSARSVLPLALRACKEVRCLLSLARPIFRVCMDNVCWRWAASQCFWWSFKARRLVASYFWGHSLQHLSMTMIERHITKVKNKTKLRGNVCHAAIAMESRRGGRMFRDSAGSIGPNWVWKYNLNKCNTQFNFTFVSIRHYNTCKKCAVLCSM